MAIEFTEILMATSLTAMKEWPFGRRLQNGLGCASRNSPNLSLELLKISDVFSTCGNEKNGKATTDKFRTSKRKQRKQSKLKLSEGCDCESRTSSVHAIIFANVIGKLMQFEQSSLDATSELKSPDLVLELDATVELDVIKFDGA